MSDRISPQCGAERSRRLASDFSSSDRKGVCPQDPTKAADLDHKVSSDVAWLADTYAVIKAKRPLATVIIGGLSSW
jgi:hypothetical protein